MLHEGLGSVGLWGEFPDRLAAATGCGVFAYSRAGYGAFEPGQAAAAARVHAYRGAGRAAESAGGDRLSPRTSGRPLRRRVDRRDLYRRRAGSSHPRAVADRAALHRRGHFGVLDRDRSRRATSRASCAQNLSRWHSDVDNAFYGWNGAWLDPKFRDWDISEYLAYIRVPVQIVQGEGDQYGTLRQIEVAQEECYCPVDVAMIAERRRTRRTGKLRTQPSKPSRVLPTGCCRATARACLAGRHERLNVHENAKSCAFGLDLSCRICIIMHIPPNIRALGRRDGRCSTATSPMAPVRSTSRPIRRVTGTGSSPSTARSRH